MCSMGWPGIPAVAQAELLGFGNAMAEGSGSAVWEHGRGLPRPVPTVTGYLAREPGWGPRPLASLTQSKLSPPTAPQDASMMTTAGSKFRDPGFSETPFSAHLALKRWPSRVLVHIPGRSHTVTCPPGRVLPWGSPGTHFLRELSSAGGRSAPGPSGARAQPDACAPTAARRPAPDCSHTHASLPGTPPPKALSGLGWLPSASWPVQPHGTKSWTPSLSSPAGLVQNAYIPQIRAEPCTAPG